MCVRERERERAAERVQNGPLLRVGPSHHLPLFPSPSLALPPLFSSLSQPSLSRSLHVPGTAAPPVDCLAASPLNCRRDQCHRRGHCRVATDVATDEARSPYPSRPAHGMAGSMGQRLAHEQGQGKARPHRGEGRRRNPWPYIEPSAAAGGGRRAGRPAGRQGRTRRTRWWAGRRRAGRRRGPPSRSCTRG